MELIMIITLLIAILAPIILGKMLFTFTVIIAMVIGDIIKQKKNKDKKSNKDINNTEIKNNKTGNNTITITTRKNGKITKEVIYK